MNFLTLPLEIITEILEKVSSLTLLSIMATNKFLASLTRDQRLWQNKLSKEYPTYKGNLYYNSVQNTVLLLELGRKIPVQYFSQVFGYINITGYTSLDNIINLYRSLDVIALKIDNGGYIGYTGIGMADSKLALIDHGPSKYYNDKHEIFAIVNNTDLLYSILLSDGITNLYLGIQEIELNLFSQIVKNYIQSPEAELKFDSIQLNIMRQTLATFTFL